MTFGLLHNRAALAFVSALVLLTGCAWPTYNQATLKAIKTESEHLMKAYPIVPPKHSVRVPRGHWPPAIEKLRPESVTVYEWGVDIWTNPYFDGGWGYHVPRRKQDLPRPAGAYSEPGPGVYWHGPL